MKDHHQAAAKGQVEVLSPEDTHPDHLGEIANSDVVGKAATIAVIGVGVALISAELIPGMIIGVAAALLPGIGPKLKPLFKSTVRAGYSAVRKTREMLAEASEQMQDVVAEARADHEAKAEPSAEPPRPSAA
jgi:hypothetical protein